MTQRRRRSLTPDEVALWSHVTRHVSRLPGGDTTPETLAETSAPPPAAQASPPVPPPDPPPAKATLRPHPAAPRPDASPPLVPLERRLRQRLSRGNHPIEAMIDLHGRRQDEAHQALRGFLERAQASGFSVVLVVTGKGSDAAPGFGSQERGVLRRTVPHWLRLPDLRAVVIGFEEAAAHHGGAGALYVRIRRRRRSG